MNIADVRQELSSDEKVLESAFKLETLYKKNKIVIWGVVMALLLFFVAKTVISAIKEAKLVEANNAYLSLQANPDDVAAQGTLKEKNPALFELYSFAQAAKKQDTAALQALSSSKNEIVTDASGYTAAVLQSKSTDSKLYEEMRLLEEAYLAIQNKEIIKAKEMLSMIDQRSSAASLALLLKHATIKGEIK